MENTTFSPSILKLHFGELTSIKYFYWMIVLIGYMVTIILNGAVIVAVLRYRSLQEPMYIFIAVLCMNGLYGSTSFFPSLLVNLLQKDPSISYTACMIQVFCIHTYGSYEITTLASMAYDRYVSICNPLRYNRIMTKSTVLKLVLGACLYPTILVVILIILTVRLPLCDNDIKKIYCDNFSVVTLSCIDTKVNNIYGIFVTVSVLGLMPLLISYSYLQIIRVCMNSSKEVKEKALQTCTPHVMTIANYLVDVLFEILVYRFPSTKLPNELKVFMSLQFMVFPPILNPFIYGLKMREIKSKVRKLFLLKQRKIQSIVIIQ